MSETALLIGGPYDHCRATLTRTPACIVLQGAFYERIDDPDDGHYLGGYAYAPKEMR